MILVCIYNSAQSGRSKRTQFDDILVCTHVCVRVCKMKSVLSHITSDYITAITFKRNLYFQTYHSTKLERIYY